MKSPLNYIYHILDEISFINDRIAVIDIAVFLQDETLKRAFSRSIEIIGEAVKNLPADYYQKYPDIPWKNMAGMRDRLIHGYFSVDYELVWDVAFNYLPPLKVYLKAKTLKYQLNREYASIW